MRTYDNISANPSLLPAVNGGGTINGSSVDTKGMTDLMAVLQAGTVDTADGNETYTINVQESADNTTFNTVAGLTVTVTASNQTKVINIPGIGTDRARYLRLQLVEAGTTPSIALCGMFLSQKYQNPVNS